MADRPGHNWTDIPEGHEVVAVPDTEWDIGTGGRRCRRAFGRGTKACGKPAVAVLRRGARGQLWAYCADHLYGRWIENGFVMHYILVKAGGDGG